MKTKKLTIIFALLAAFSIIFSAMFFASCGDVEDDSSGNAHSFSDYDSLSAYLNGHSNGDSVSNPIPIKITGNQIDWQNLQKKLNTAGKYVSLDLSASTGMETLYSPYTSTDWVVSIILPDTTTTIGEGAFHGCTNLDSVTIGNSVTTIGEYAFSGCVSLANVMIPDSVTSIGNDAFENCTSLTNVTIPDSVTTIGSWAFNGCTSLASVTIPDSVTEIGSVAFLNCISLTSVTFEKTGITIQSNAFTGDLGSKYNTGGMGTYTTTPFDGNRDSSYEISNWNPEWTKS